MRIEFSDNVIMEIGFSKDEANLFEEKLKLNNEGLMFSTIAKNTKFNSWCCENLNQVKGVIAVIDTSFSLGSIILRAQNKQGIENAIEYLENFIKS